MKVEISYHHRRWWLGAFDVLAWHFEVLVLADEERLLWPLFCSRESWRGVRVLVALFIRSVPAVLNASFLFDCGIFIII